MNVKLIAIAEKELLKTGMTPECAKEFAKSFCIGFPKILAEIYGRRCFEAGAKQQKEICAKTKLVNKYCDAGLDLARAIKYEVANAPDPVFK